MEKNIFFVFIIITYKKFNISDLKYAAMDPDGSDQDTQYCSKVEVH
jgi:hypothetical protein